MAADPTQQPAEGAPKKPKKKRRALRVVGVIVGVPLFLAAAGVGYLHTGSGKAKVKGAIEERLRERVDGTVDVGVVDYTLFGDVKLGDVHVKDSAGVEAIALSGLTVSPSWSDLLTGNLVIDRVNLQGLAVHVIKDAEGGSNLQHLLKPRPEDPSKKPLDKRILVKSLAIGDVGVDILQPDGAKIVVSNFSVDGSLVLQPANRDVEVEIGKIGFTVAVDRGQGGLKLGITGVETGITVKLEHGLGKATLHPLKGHVAVTLPDKPERGFDLDLGGFSADIGQDGLGVSLERLLAGAVALASVEIKGHVIDGKMDGKQDADVLGLKVSGARVNELLGQNVLLGDIEVETHIHGPPDKIEIGGKVTTAGARLDIDGSIGIGDPASPTYDMAVSMTGVDTEKMLAPEMGFSPVGMEKLEISVKGRGRKSDTAGATGTLKLTGVTSRGLRIDGIDLEGELDKGILKVKSAEVRALGQKVTASGEVELANKRIDLTLGIDGDVGDALARLKAAGFPVKANLPKGAVRLPQGDLQVTAKGFLAGTIDVHATAKKMSVLGGTLGLDASAALIRHDPPLADGKKITVSSMDADLKIGGIKLSSLLAMRGKKLPGMDGTLSGDVHLEGTPQSPRAKLLLAMLTSREDKGKTVRLSLAGNIDSKLADLDVVLTPASDQNKLFALHAKLPLSLGGPKKGIDPYGSLDVHADLPKKTLDELWTFVPSEITRGTIQKLPDGDLALSLDLKGTPAKPEGKVNVVLATRFLPGLSPKVEIGATIKPEGQGLVAHADVSGWYDDKAPRLLHVGGDVDLSRSPVLGKPEIAYRGKVEVGPLDMALPSSVLWKAGMLDEPIPGTVMLAADLNGNKEDLKGKVLVTVDGAYPKKVGPVAAVLMADVGESSTDVGLKVRIPEVAEGQPTSELASLSGKVALGGNKLFAQLKDKEHLDPGLSLALDIPRRALASLASLFPRLEKGPGNLAGRIDVTGTAKLPLAKGAIALTDVKRMDGEMGGAALSIDASKDQILALLGAGTTDPKTAPLQISVSAQREAIAKMGDGAELPLVAQIRAKAADIRQLVPYSLLGDTKVGVSGTLDWNMDVKAQLVKTKTGVAAASGFVSGNLDLHDAKVALPGTKRAYHDINLLLKGDEKGLHLDALRAKETDLETQDRNLTVKADIGLDKLKPTVVTLSLAAEKWLLFGPRALGFADAPRGTLTLAARAKADLTQPIKTATVDVDKLELFVPERFERAHQPEDVQAGDVVILDAKKKNLGKLSVPGVEEAAVAKKAEPKEEPGKESGFDVTVRVADGAHLLQAPIELSPKGEITVKIRGAKRDVRGALKMTAGALSLGGQKHPLVTGTLTFDDKNPAGYLDLYFERPLKAFALRDISQASAGDSVKIHMYGSLADRKTVLSGAGSPGALWDLLSVNNVGRQRYVSEPDLPASMSVDFPQHDSLLVLSFLSVNLPHLLFLDRFAAWADPYDDPRSYGRLTHFEAERLVAGDSVRVRTAVRPPTAGQSEAEVEIDYLFVNVPRMLFGVGLTGGTRGGGGPGVVWEWSSKD